MGYFFREADYDQDSDYAEFCNLKIDFLHRWSKTSWSGQADNLFIYITINNNQLWIGKNEREMDEPKLKLVGVYKEKNNLIAKEDFKKALKKYLNSNIHKREKLKSLNITTREICSYMRWKIDDDMISDFIIE